ncbi:MAG: OmpH family outer membrane protein [Sphingomonadaceae bacterium]
MRTILKATAAAAMIVAAPAFAQVAVADLEGAVARTTAFQNAQNQIKTTYKTQIDTFNARQTALGNQLKPLQTELQTLQRNPATQPATFQAKVNTYQTQENKAKEELQRLATPFARPTAYAQAQVSEKLDDAIKAAMTAKGVKVVISPDATLAVAPDANLTPEITNQLNTLVKTVSITPPANWQPGQPTTAAAAPTSGR